MDKYNIRVCEIEDLQTVYKMICLLEGGKSGIEEFTGVFKDNLNDPNIHYIITETDNRPIGFAGMHIQKILHHTGSVGELIEMYVDPDFRNEESERPCSGTCVIKLNPAAASTLK